MTVEGGIYSNTVFLCRILTSYQLSASMLDAEVTEDTSNHMIGRAVEVEFCLI